MLIIELQAQDNGAHRNQEGEFTQIPAGWAPVMPDIEEEAKGYLPFIVIDETDRGWITAVSQGEIPEPEAEPVDYIPTPEQSAVVMMRAAFASQAATMDDDQIIQCSGLADDWTPGDHKVGEVVNTRAGVHAKGVEWDQTWEVYQAYNNGTFPDIKPGDPSWYTFNRPLHGTSPETARPWVAPMGAHDMYRAGEYMVYTDGKIYRCKSDTNFSPEDYPQAWESVS